MKISIVVPAYNEEDRIAQTLDEYTAFFFGAYGDDVELIVAVNGSHDRTEEIARSYTERFPNLRVLVEQEAIGKGGAIVMGFKVANGDLIGFVDADCSTPPAAYNDLLLHIDEADAIIASRRLPGAVVEPKQPLKRRFVSRVFNGLVRLLFGFPITDTQCGAKVVKREVIMNIMPDLGLTRWAFDVDFLFQLNRHGYRVIERATVWRDKGGSKLRILKTSFDMLLAIIRLRLIYSPLRWIVTLYDRSLGRAIHLPAYD